MISGYLAEHGPGLHHVAYVTRDIEAEMARLADEGMRLIDTEPRTGVRGSRIAFLEPDGTGHVLTELVQPAPTSRPPRRPPRRARPSPAAAPPPAAAARS